MANSLGTLATGVVIPAALDLVFTKRPLLSRISLGVSNERCRKDQTIYTRTLGIPAVGNFGDSAVDTADTDVSVTLSNHKQVLYSFTADQQNKSERNLVAEHAPAMAVAMANSMVDAIGALWTTANYTNESVVTAPAYGSLVDVRAALAARNGMLDGAFMAVNAATYGAFLKDELIVAADKNARSQAINTGVISAVAGFDIFEYPAIISTNTLIGFAGLKDSAVLAMRAPSNPQDISDAPYAGKLTYVTGPESGITVMVNEWIDQSTLAVNVRLIWLYGVAVGNATNGQRVVSAAT
jgi:hypothetical protein